MEYKSRLNKQQLEAVIETDVPLRVIAGAGTGKTSVLTARFIHLLSDLNISASKILAITFTNKAAKEMRERIRSQVSASYSFPYILTYHAFGLRILKEDIDKLGRSKDFLIIDDEDQKSILKEIISKLGLEGKSELTSKNVLEYISNNKNNLNPVSKALDIDRNTKDEEKAIIYGQYQTYLKTHNYLDFDDLLVLTYQLFKSHEEVVKKWSNRFDFIMVDEFQDTNDIQYQIISMLSKTKQNLFVVGDPDQTIYSWRGANIDLILNLSNDFPKLKTVVLELNYRSTNNILKASNLVIANNENRVPKNLYSNNPTGISLSYYCAQSLEREALWVANKILELNKTQNDWKKFLILYRSNFLSREIEQKLISLAIPYQIFGGIRFFQRREVKDVLAYLKVISNWDDASLKRIINVPSRKISQQTLTDLQSFADSHNMTLSQVVNDLNNLDVLKSAARSAVINFASQVNRIRQTFYPTLVDLVRAVLVEFKYLEFLEEDSTRARVENIEELINAIAEFESRQEEQKPSLLDFFNEISLYSSHDEEKSQESVTLMTIHTAKGLEFDNVFIIGMNEGIIPSSWSMMTLDGIEEERRILYVGMTRARHSLFLTCNTGFSYVSKNDGVPSRFLEEIPSDIINNINEVYRPLTKFSEEFFNSKTVQPKRYGSVNYVETKRAFANGDIILHEKFGEGTIVNCAGEIIEVAFSKPYGTRTLMANHKSITRKRS